MFNKVIKFIGVFLFLIICFVNAKAQDTFVTKFNSLADETDGLFMQNTNNEYIGIITKKNADDTIRPVYLYKLNTYGDTVLNRRFGNNDTIISIYYFIQYNANPIEYLVTGRAYRSDESEMQYFSFFTKIDANFNPIWENFYRLRPDDVNSSVEFWPRLLQKGNGGYLFATNISHPGDDRLILFDLSEQGDSLQYKMYEGDSAGVTLMCLTYNHDSTAYQIFTTEAHDIPFNGEAQCITVDFDFNQTDVQYYPRWFDDGLTAKLLPDGSLVTGGLFAFAEPPPFTVMATFKHDTNFNLLAECHVSDPDVAIRKDNGFKSLDYYYPNSIFIAGTFDYDVGIWIPHPSWIVIGKMDSNLNLLTEKYIGGDAYYHFNTITATSDGGALITTTRYDYLTQYHEHDVYIIKLDSLDLLVGNTEHPLVQIADAIVYPNPASDYVCVRTSVKNAGFAIYDLNGKKVMTKAITGLITQIKINELPAGTYVWHIYRQSKLIETGKFIKTN